MNKLVAEFIGTAFLVMIVFGSGIMAESLAQGNVAIALLCNSLATGAGLFVLIQSLGALSGAHFNPVVSMVETLWKRMTFQEMFRYWLAQFTGAIAGVLLTHAMYNQTLIQISQTNRAEPHLWFSEVVATFGLISVIHFAGKRHVEFAPMTIAAYITSAYWFTSSTSFANPAVTVARALTNTFCGSAPNGLLYFIAAQFLGAVFAFYVSKKGE